MCNLCQTIFINFFPDYSIFIHLLRSPLNSMLFAWFVWSFGTIKFCSEMALDCDFYGIRKSRNILSIVFPHIDTLHQRRLDELKYSEMSPFIPNLIGPSIFQFLRASTTHQKMIIWSVHFEISTKQIYIYSVIDFNIAHYY